MRDSFLAQKEMSVRLDLTAKGITSKILYKSVHPTNAEDKLKQSILQDSEAPIDKELIK